MMCFRSGTTGAIRESPEHRRPEEVEQFSQQSRVEKQSVIRLSQSDKRDVTCKWLEKSRMDRGKKKIMSQMKFHFRAVPDKLSVFHYHRAATIAVENKREKLWKTQSWPLLRRGRVRMGSGGQSGVGTEMAGKVRGQIKKKWLSPSFSSDLQHHAFNRFIFLSCQLGMSIGTFFPRFSFQQINSNLNFMC